MTKELKEDLGGGFAGGWSGGKMKRPYKGRWCSRFHCDKRGDRYCCADCPERKRDRCRNPCMNDPARCKLEDRNRRQA